MAERFPWPSTWYSSAKRACLTVSLLSTLTVRVLFESSDGNGDDYRTHARSKHHGSAEPSSTSPSEAQARTPKEDKAHRHDSHGSADRKTRATAQAHAGLRLGAFWWGY